jgi:hypothetical protein
MSKSKSISEKEGSGLNSPIRMLGNISNSPPTSVTIPAANRKF